MYWYDMRWACASSDDDDDDNNDDDEQGQTIYE